ncbi:MAG: hypothetical protein ABSH19_05890 [Opitutales bacterium]
MTFAVEIRARLAPETAGWPAPPAEADARLERLTAISPVYRNLVARYPDYWCWVELPQNRDEAFRYGAFAGIWREEFKEGERTAALRRFRRKMSFRAAYREVNGLCTVAETLRELSLLAELVLREALAMTRESWERRLGTPWDEATGAAARFCVLALGKLGGEEINFCSDVDLILFYQGEGHCRKNGQATAMDNGEYFTRLARDFCALLQERTGDGFLYNVDLRLRPEGDAGRLVPSWTAMTNYYWAAGQTWERLAFIRARPVAGDLKLGQELLEELNPFRYPRAVSPGLLQEVAGVKIRLEHEVVGRERLERDIKSGYGGIREVEFSVQAQQLLEAGRNPFLQTNFLPEAMERLARYHLLPEAEANFLKEAYRFLRLVENRLQLREEEAVHQLPAYGPEREKLAASLGFPESRVFEEKLAALREGVRRHYAGLFAENTREEELQEWTLVLGGREPSPAMREKIARWFPDSTDALERLRKFVLGAGGPLMREQVGLFLDVSAQFDTVLPRLARPLQTLERVAKFGEKYGARRMFFKALVGNPGLFQALALLFDRSTAIHEWLCAHPGIMEELLYVAAQRRKSPTELDGEIAALAKEGEDFPRLLRLYVKAEQVRAAMAELLFNLAPEEIEQWLTGLADAALAATLRMADPEGRLTVIALGKYGAGELAIGSDLDVLVLAPEGDAADDARRVTAWRQMLDQQHPLGRAFELDMRLRPHGRDGPLVATLAAMRAYHQAGGGAQAWERQLLTRARLAAGGIERGQELLAWRDVLLYSGPASAGAREDLRHMRLRIETEKTRRTGAERAFKTGPGGLLDVEFAAQWLQLAHGWETPALRSPTTRTVLRAARDSGHLKTEQAGALLEHYEVLRHVEWALRRETGTGVSVLPEEPREVDALAVWLGRANGRELLAELRLRRAEVRQIFEEVTGPQEAGN